MRFKKTFIVSVCLFSVLFSSYAFASSVRLGVMRFVSKADGVSSYQAEAAGDVFVRVLANNTNNISILERDRLDEILAEQNLSMSGYVDANKAVQFGRIAGCQYMLMGSITNLKAKQSSVNLPFAIGIGVRESSATATIDVRIVDVETTEIVGAFSETGSGKQSGASVSVYGADFDSDELSGMEADAIAKATEKLAPKIIKLLTRVGRATNSDEITFSRSRTATTHAERRANDAKRNTSSLRRTTAIQNNYDYDDYDDYDENQQEDYEFENYSTKPEDVIPTYGLSEQQTKNLINAHNRFWKNSNKKAAYERISGLYDENNNDYLAAYRAGLLAQQLGTKEDAKAWFEVVLSINPNYEPAQKALEKVSSSSSRKRRK